MIALPIDKFAIHSLYIHGYVTDMASFIISLYIEIPIEWIIFIAI